MCLSLGIVCLGCGEVYYGLEPCFGTWNKVWGDLGELGSGKTRRKTQKTGSAKACRGKGFVCRGKGLSGGGCRGTGLISGCQIWYF